MTVLFDPAWQLGVSVNRANCELAVEAGGEQQSLGVAAQPSAVGSALTWAERGPFLILYCMRGRLRV